MTLKFTPEEFGGHVWGEPVIRHVGTTICHNSGETEFDYSVEVPCLKCSYKAKGSITRKKSGGSSSSQSYSDSDTCTKFAMDEALK